MTDTTPNLALPELIAAQAQKHVTVNEALRALDALVQLAVLDRNLTSPPGEPAEGARWLVAAGASGDWSGHDDDIAAWQDGGWSFYPPQIGWLAYVVDEGALIAWIGSGWADAIFTPASLNDMALLGVGTTADSTNPFSAKLNNALWTALYSADGGDGDLRYKLNKETPANVLSLLMQSNYAGRAEIGLIGDDDLQIKVSPDGSSWFTGIKVDRASGKVSFPETPIRECLDADRTYYVRSDGSDSNDGLANTSGGAFLTIQKAIDVILATLDLGGKNVIIQVASGTYAGTIAVNAPWVGGGTVTLQGDLTTPSNVVISTASTALDVRYNGQLSIGGFKITTSAGIGINATFGGQVRVVGPMEFGSIANVQVRAALLGVVNFEVGVNYAISGGAVAHMQAAQNGSIQCTGSRTVTLSGTPAFGIAFVWSRILGSAVISSVTYSGSATGSRYLVEISGVLMIGGLTLPGSSAGTTATGGQLA